MNIVLPLTLMIGGLVMIVIPKSRVIVFLGILMILTGMCLATL